RRWRLASRPARLQQNVNLSLHEPLAKALAGGERKRTPGIVQHEFAPAAAGVRGDPATPAGVRIVVPLLPGSSLRSPPANPVGAEYVIVFMKSCSKAQQSMALGELWKKHEAFEARLACVRVILGKSLLSYFAAASFLGFFASS